MSDTAPARYEIRTVADFLKVPADRRAACLAEFPKCLEYAEAFGGFLDACGANGARFDVYVWTDDGVERVSACSATTRGKEFLRMNINYGEPTPDPSQEQP